MRRSTRPMRSGGRGGRRWRRRVLDGALMLTALFALACESRPPRIALGDDRCGFCLMGIAEERFAAAMVTRTHKANTFDSIECMAAFVSFEPAGSTVRSLWVTDYESPGRLIDAQRAFFAISDSIRSPMGLGLAAFSSQAARDAALARGTGHALTWSDVLDVVRRHWPDGSPHGSRHSTAGGAGEAGADSLAHGTGARLASLEPAVAGPAQHGGHTPAGDMAMLLASVRNASAGERIVVAPGVYRGETLVIDRPLELVGDGRAILDGEGERELIRVRADGVTIRGLVLRNVGTTFVDDRAAIRVENAAGCRIEDNRIEDAFFGIYLAKVAGCEVRGNVLSAAGRTESGSGNGIHLWNSRDIVIDGNTITGHRDGIYFEFVKDSRASNNRSENNLRYGLHFMFSDRCRYEDNVFRSNRAGVAVMYTNEVEMVGNSFAHNRGSATFGLLLKDIRDSRIERNRFEWNSVAMVADGSDRLTVTDNEFEHNGWAIKVMANSERNRFSRNNFTGNTFDVATNSRQNFSTFDGNYWDAYRGHDLDRDGVGDVPHRPVRLFSLLVERNEPSLILLRSFLVRLLDAAESVVPVLTPATLVDANPRMSRVERVERMERSGQ